MSPVRYHPSTSAALGRLLVLPVADHHVRAAHDNLARHPRGAAALPSCRARRSRRRPQAGRLTRADRPRDGVLRAEGRSRSTPSRSRRRTGRARQSGTSSCALRNRSVVIGDPACPSSRNDDTSRGRAPCSSTRAPRASWAPGSPRWRGGARSGRGCRPRRMREAARATHRARGSTPTEPCPRRGRTAPPRGRRRRARNRHARVLWNEFATRLRWVSMTPLGRPVVPPVKYRSASSSSSPSADISAGSTPSRSASHSSKVTTRGTASPSGPGSRSVTSRRGRAASAIATSSAGARRVFSGSSTIPARGHAHVRLDVVVAVAGEDRDAITAPQPERCHRRTHAIAAISELGVADRAVTTDERSAGGVGASRSRQGRGDRRGHCTLSGMSSSRRSR